MSGANASPTRSASAIARSLKKGQPSIRRSSRKSFAPLGLEASRESAPALTRWATLFRAYGAVALGDAETKHARVKRQFGFCGFFDACGLPETVTLGFKRHVLV